MKTKIYLSLALALLCLLPAAAQTDVQPKERGFFLEMNFGYGRVDGTFHEKDGYAIVMPALGYQITPRWAVGVKPHFETGADCLYTSLGAYAQYRFLKRPRWSLFAEASISYNLFNEDLDGCFGPNYNYTEAGFNLGASYALSRHWSLMARYLYIGYNDARPFRWDVSGCWKSGDFMLDANVRRLSIGVQYRF